MIRRSEHESKHTPRTLYVFGSGGFGREVAWLASRCSRDPLRIVYLVDDPKYIGTGLVAGHAVQTVDETIPDQHAEYVIAVGEPSLKRRAAKLLDSRGLRPACLVHPSTEMSYSVDLGPGAIVCAGSVLTVDIRVGVHVHLNLNCTVGHDVIIGDFTTICPGTNISGNVRIGNDVFIGTGACIINGNSQTPIVIGDGATIAAGACVTRSVEPGALVAGVPAIRKR